MAGPWEKYKATASDSPSPESSTGPWAKYRPAPDTVQPALAKKDGILETLAKNPLDVLNAPFQAVGEAIRMPLEGDSDFRAPTIMQKMGLGKDTEKAPGDPFQIANALLRSGAELVRTGSTDAAKREYSRDAGIPGAIQDTALAVVSGKIAPNIVNAPIEVIPKIAGAFAKAGKVVGKGAIRAALGPTAEAQSARFRNRASVVGAKEDGEIADLAAETANRLSEDVSKADTAAWKTLRTSYDPYEGAVPKDQAQKVVRQAIEDLKVYGGGLVGKQAKAAQKILNDIAADIGTVGKFVGGKLKSQQNVPSSINRNTYLPEQSIKGIIQSLDRGIDWGDESASAVNQVLEKARVALDTGLKTQNPKYAEAMTPVAEKMKTLSALRQKFALKNQVGAGFVSSDATAGKVKQLGSGARKMPETTRVTEAVARETGVDLAREARLSNFKEQFRPGRKEANGSRRAVVGAIAGESIGRTIGLPPIMSGAMGAGAGATLDYFGGATAGALIDKLAQGKSGIAQLLAILERKAGNSPQAVSALQELIRNSGAYGPAIRMQDQRR